MKIMFQPKHLDMDTIAVEVLVDEPSSTPQFKNFVRMCLIALMDSVIHEEGITREQLYNQLGIIHDKTMHAFNEEPFKEEGKPEPKKAKKTVNKGLH